MRDCTGGITFIVVSGLTGVGATRESEASEASDGRRCCSDSACEARFSPWNVPTAPRDTVGRGVDTVGRRLWPFIGDEARTGEAFTCGALI